MYCKHCGKEIADDSKFCQHCGEKLDTTSSTPKVVSEQKSNESVVATKNYESSAIKFFAKNKVYIVLNIIWVIINILLLLQGKENIYEYSHGGHRFKANEVFYPFTSTGYQTSYSFNAKYYDWTEFLVYCLLIPLIVYILIMIWKSPVGESVKTWIRKFEATEQDNSGLTNSNLTSTHDKIEDEENRKEEVSASITNETSTQTKYDSGVYDDNNDEVTLDGFLEFIVDAIKIMGVILFSFLALTLSLMYIRNFILGCLLSIGSGILTFYAAVLPALCGLALISCPLWLPSVSFSLAEVGMALLLFAVAAFLSLRQYFPALAASLGGTFLLLLCQDYGTAVVWGLVSVLVFWTGSDSLLWSGISLVSSAGLFAILTGFVLPVPDAAPAMLSRIAAMPLIPPETIAEDSAGVGSPESLYFMFGEQYGLIFLFCALLLLIALLIRGASLALHTRKSFHASLSLGIVLLLGLRALLFLAAAAGLLPVAPGAFPFLTSSAPDLFAHFFLLGLLSGVSARNDADLEEDARLAMLAH